MGPMGLGGKIRGPVEGNQMEKVNPNVYPASRKHMFLVKGRRVRHVEKEEKIPTQTDAEKQLTATKKEEKIMIKKK